MASDTADPSAVPVPPGGVEPATSGRSRRGRWIALGVVVALVIVGAVVAIVATSDDGGEQNRNQVASPTSPPTQAPTTTGAPVTVPVDLSPAVFPAATSSQRFADPVSAARAFATDYLGFVSPVIGEFRAGDSRSGEVTVRAKTVTPATTVNVRQLGDTWWVLGASTESIQVARPGALETISSPVTLQGTSTAFEATVNVEVRDDATRVLGRGFVMGGANGVMGPFSGAQAFTTSSTPLGAAVLATYSSEDGRLLEAAVVRVRFATSGVLRASLERLVAGFDATVFQFSNVSSVEYRINGDCNAFATWLQLSSCGPRTRGSSQ